MNQEPPLLSPKVCPKCGAANYAHVQKCWLCYAALEGLEQDVNPYAVRRTLQPAIPISPGSSPLSEGQSRTEAVFLWLLVAMVVLAVIVGIGIGVQERGLLTLYLFVMVPAFGAAGIRALYSLAKGETVKPSKMISTMILSVALTFGMGAMLLICGVIFLFLTCAQMLSGGMR